MLVLTHVLSKAQQGYTQKFAPERDDPYVIIKQISPTSYQLASLQTPNMPLGVYHSLTPYRSLDNGPRAGTSAEEAKTPTSNTDHSYQSRHARTRVVPEDGHARRLSLPQPRRSSITYEGIYVILRGRLNETPMVAHARSLQLAVLNQDR